MKIKRYVFPVLMGASMSNIMSLVNLGKIVFPNILVMMLMQAAVASAASMIFPAGVYGSKWTKRLFPRLSYVPFLLVSSILPAIFFTAVMSISGLLKMKGYSSEFWPTYFSSLPSFSLYGYAVSLVWNILLDQILKTRRKADEK